MTKLELFDYVVSVMNTDSSTIKDITGADPEPYRQKITESMSDDDFEFLVQSYLGTFGVLSPVGFRKAFSEPLPLCSLRYYQDSLYVTDCQEGLGLKKGDCILALDGESILECQRRYADFLTSKTPERQYFKWSALLFRAKQVRLLRQGQECLVTMPTDLVASNPVSDFSWNQLTDDTVYMAIGDFWQEDKIYPLYEATSKAIQKSPNLIIDVRANKGGSDIHYLPLLQYALPEGVGLYDVLDDEDDGMEILYTERSVALRLKAIYKELASPTLTPDIKAFLEDFKKNLEDNRGKGFVTYESDDDADDPFKTVKGLSYPEKIVVLSDVRCGSSGDSFVSIMKEMPKVTVIGRPTLGVLDYSNVAVMPIGQYELVFPTSRSKAIDSGKGMIDKGIEPDILIPWTPEHLEKDIDLEHSLIFLEQK